MSEQRILLTGFGPFPGVEDNPTSRICATLDGQKIEGCTVHSAIFTVRFSSIEADLASAWDACCPQIVLLTGVAIRRESIGIEIRAVNRREAQRPDAEGTTPGEEEPLSKNMPLDASLDSNANATAILEALRLQELPAEISDDAGRYLCNGVFFHALERSRSLSHAPICVFLHLPQVGNLKGNSKTETWTLDLLTQATSLVLKSLLTDMVSLNLETT